jgi:hypothetical protein
VSRKNTSQEPTMTQSIVSYLRPILFADATTCLATGLLMTTAASPLSELLGLPHGLLFEAGLSLFPIAAFIAGVGARASTSWLAVAAVAAGNLAWVLASLWVVAGGSFAPNVWGVGFVGAQALVVLGFAALEGRGALALRVDPHGQMGSL